MRTKNEECSERMNSGEILIGKQSRMILYVQVCYKDRSGFLLCYVHRATFTNVYDTLALNSIPFEVCDYKAFSGVYLLYLTLIVLDEKLQSQSGLPILYPLQSCDLHEPMKHFFFPFSAALNPRPLLCLVLWAWLRQSGPFLSLSLSGFALI